MRSNPSKNSPGQESQAAAPVSLQDNLRNTSAFFETYAGYCRLVSAVNRMPGQGRLDDVVVVGYGKQRKVTSVGAQSSIGTKELV